MQHTPKTNNKKNKLILWAETKTYEMGLHRHYKTKTHLWSPSVVTQPNPKTAQKIKTTKQNSMLITNPHDSIYTASRTGDHV